MAERIKYVRRAVVASSLALGAAGIAHGVAKYESVGNPDKIRSIARGLYDASADLATSTESTSGYGKKKITVSIPKDPDPQASAAGLQKAKERMATRSFDTAPVQFVIARLARKSEAVSYKDEQIAINNIAQGIVAEADSMAAVKQSGTARGFGSLFGGGIAAFMAWVRIRGRNE